MKKKGTKSEEKPKKVNSTAAKKTIDPQLPPMQMVKSTNKTKN